MTSHVDSCRNISVSTPRRWLRDGRLPGIRLGKRWYAIREAVVGRIENLAEPGDGPQPGRRTP